MERYWGDDTVFVLIGALFTLFMAVRAWKNGAMDLLWTLTSWTGGAMAGFWVYQNGAEILHRYFQVQLSAGMSVLVSVVLGVAVFALVRGVTKQFFNKIFGPDTAAGAWMYGGTGSILSILPSLAILILFGLLIRMTGTMYELRQIDFVSATRDAWNLESYPAEPSPTRWRNAVENLPRGEAVLDLFDPVSSVARRNLAAILVASYNPYLKQELRRQPGTRAAANHSLVVQLSDYEAEITQLVAGVKGDWKYFRLLKHPKVEEALQDKALRQTLSEMDAAAEIRAILTGQQHEERTPWLQRIFS